MKITRGWGKLMKENLEIKQKEFNAAIKRYEDRKIYKAFTRGISVINILAQFILIFMLYKTRITLLWQVFAIVLSYIIADFINGLVHMYMDNNDNYNSIAGPFIASFHLHHKKPLYRKNKIVLVYFNEAGSKIWLAFFSIVAIVIVSIFNINPVILHMILYFSIFSCIAELSHYLCHVSDNKISESLRKFGLLLRRGHHGKHHLEDNINYAFLNGMSDPLINIIAKKFYAGYKNTTDKHYLNYKGKGTENR